MTEWTVAIQGIEAVGPDTIAIALAAPDGFDAKPGQFVKVTAFVDGEHVSRFYTLSSSHVTDTFELTVGVEPDATVSPWLRDATGEHVEIEGPYGTAYYDGAAHTLVIAGGPGIGAAVGVGERAVSEGHEIAIIYRSQHPAHRDRLRALERAGAVVVLTDELRGPVADHLTDDQDVLVYGFQGLVTDALAAIEDAGGEPDTARVENYG